MAMNFWIDYSAQEIVEFKGNQITLNEEL